MVAQLRLAPVVAVVAGVDLQAAHEDMVEPVAHLAVWVEPAAVAPGVAVQSAEGVAVAVLGQADHDAQLRAVVALAVVRPQLPRARAREGAHLPLARLVLRRVEVADQDARHVTWSGQIRSHRLERSHLHLVRLARYRRVEVADLHVLAVDSRAREEKAFGPRHVRAGQRLHRILAREYYAEAAIGLELDERVMGVEGR